MNASERPTPETDAAAASFDEIWEDGVSVDFARKLERERDALREALQACYDAADRPPSVSPFMDSCNEVRRIARAALQ